VSAIAWLRADPRRLDVAIAAVTALLGTLLVLGAPDDYDAGWPEVAAGVGAFVLVALRRRQPLVLLAVAMVWTTVHVAVWDRPTAMVFAILVLLTTACIRLERWPAIGLGAVVAAWLYTVGLITNETQYGDARAVIGIAWTAGAVGIADAIRSWRRYTESAEAELQAAVVAAEAEASRQLSEERLVIARELHDLLAHNLSVMNVQTGAALHLLRSDPDQAEASLTTARDAGKTVLDELRELLAVLRHEHDDGVPMSSLPSADDVDRLVDTMRASGLHVDWNRSGAPRPLSSVASLAAYRIVQEGLTNAAKHGDGSVALATAWADDGLTITIENGTAGDVDETGAGLGLVGMRERAAVNGGRLTVDAGGDRFVVEAWLPADGEVTS
jgi:signal transduction histidine kinase